MVGTDSEKEKNILCFVFLNKILPMAMDFEFFFFLQEIEIRKIDFDPITKLIVLHTLIKAKSTRKENYA